MSKENEIGQFWQKTHVEWTIKDIFSYTVVDNSYTSPRFTVQGSRFYFRIFPNGQTKYESSGWIGLFLVIDDSIPRISVNYTLGVKKTNDVIQELCTGANWVAHAAGEGNGSAKFLERSKLLQRKDELLPSDALTLTCSVKVIDSSLTISIQNKLLKDFADLLISKKGCDATLRVQNRNFPVHKCILAARSTVFSAMFENDMKEKQTGIVDIEDCDPTAFRDFLRYLYTGKFQTDPNNVFELYRIADKYCEEELKSACALYITHHVSEENICQTAVLADCCNDARLEEKAQVFFNDNFGKICSTEHWDAVLDKNKSLAKKLLANMASAKKL